MFCRNEKGEIFHSYSTYARGLDILVGTYSFLDLVPKGRDENPDLDHGLGAPPRRIRKEREQNGAFELRRKDVKKQQSFYQFLGQ